MDRETNKILSIIVPTYNAEKFLDKGLSSFLVDDNSILNEIEVVVVNDGKPDRTKDNICVGRQPLCRKRY